MNWKNLRFFVFLFGTLITFFLLKNSTQKVFCDEQIAAKAKTYPSSHVTSRILELEKEIENLCLRKEAKVAIIVPYFNNCEKLVRVVRRWANEDFYPCEEWEKEYPEVDLVFSSGLSPNSEKKCDNIIKEAFNEGNYSSCFKSVSYTFESLDDKNHDQGSRAHFILLLDRYSQTHDYIFVMEADTQPIRRGWVKKIKMECRCGEDFLVKGSYLRTTNPTHVRQWGWHINGNALYKVNTTLLPWIKRVAVVPPTYDVAIARAILSPDNALETRDFLHMYKYAEFIQNIFHYKRWNSYAMAKAFPYTYFVHGADFVDDINGTIPWMEPPKIN